MTQQAVLRDLYPIFEPFESGFLEVGDGHSLYYEISGNPNGIPAVVLHGGPGGGCDPWYRQFFNPAVYKVVMFDQRGAGKSLPHASLEANTTWKLVEDIDKIKKKANVEGKWVVFGGSWGSTLALAYAITYPEHCRSLILRGIFMCRRSELLWFYQEGASHIFADAWESYIAPIPPAERFDMMTAYYRRLTGTDKEVQLKCAQAWAVWEMQTSRLYVDPAYVKRANENAHFALAFARIECHYFVNAAFFNTDGWILENIGKIKDIPGVIVQGRYDLVCPLKSAWDLSKVWTKGELHVIPDAGHSAKEPGILSKLVEACDKFGV